MYGKIHRNERVMVIIGKGHPGKLDLSRFWDCFGSEKTSYSRVNTVVKVDYGHSTYYMQSKPV